jgi:hypothetical protein
LILYSLMCKYAPTFYVCRNKDYRYHLGDTE